MARSASSLPGMTQSTRSGSQLVSTMATTGMPMRRASRTAITSEFGSITNIASGGVAMFSTPEKFCCRCFSSRSRRARFLLGKLRHAAVFDMALQKLQALDGFLQRDPIGERAAQPAVIHVEHAAALGFFLDGFLSLALGAQKQDDFALRGLFGNVARSFAEHFQGLLKIDNVNAVAFAENVFLHLRIPAPRLVAEVNSGLQKLFHRNFDSQSSSSRRRDALILRLAGDSILFCRFLAGREFGSGRPEH